VGRSFISPGRYEYGGRKAIGSRWRATLRRLWWAAMPVWSVGTLSCVPFFRQAIATGRRKDWLVTLGYLGTTVVMLVLVSTDQSPDPDAAGGIIQTIGGGLAILLMGGGAAHAATIYRSPDGPPSLAADPSLAALATAKEAAARRDKARRIAETDPALARDLKIGRPDLQRTFDDGGLVDVNHLSAEYLVDALDWTPAEARAVIDARTELGGFSSSAEVSAYAAIDPDRVDAVADLLVFRRG
jgi:DNA uptake protein ComE-like DNA-binding protein